MITWRLQAGRPKSKKSFLFGHLFLNVAYQTIESLDLPRNVTCLN